MSSIIPRSELERRFGTILGSGVDAEDIAFFHTETWTRRWIDDPRYSTISITSRLPKITGQDDFTAKTLQTPATIPRWLFLAQDSVVSESKSAHTSVRECPDIVLLVKLEQGTNGFRDTAHGGVLCTLLDETQSTCVEFRRRSSSSTTTMLYTARLGVEFRRPVRTPSVVMVKAWLSGVDGRKWNVEGEIVDSEDTVLATSSSLWISPRSDRL